MGTVFEVDRIERTSDDQIEVVGRWFGVRGRRFIRPTLSVEVDGESRRMLAVLDHKPWVAEDGEEWVAGFEWAGEPTDLTGAELTVGPDLEVELLPEGEEAAGKKRPARRSRASVLEAELGEARREVERLTRKLKRENDAHLSDVTQLDSAHAAEVDRLREEKSALEEARAREVEELKEKLDGERERLRAKVEAERERAEKTARELEAARKAAGEDVARVEAEAERLGKELEAARRESAAARADSEAAKRERDRARQERDATVTSVRSTSAPKERRTVSISAEPASDAAELKRIRPGLYRWEERAEPPGSARLVAVAAVAAIFMILVLLILQAT